ncbi:hypothetical protein FIM10_12235 [Sphingomonadales bacterium 56]|uniref:hypothetical protein n=1 Tax=unclassified Sphingobium TaxID=2611147 RepID=UPI00191A40E9|nr:MULTISPECIES: hypothetical protein [unclassified Sphingobium]MBY2929441.1 hypothetical protein [Sphingomonadales bacterium 56]MBY2958717.1 hypothetical protein [Sphingomonadales bacterium 58]CAD7337642.1 hypothetical protein SPHS8_01657 [Sphingobium sp. S8]CAD7339470.1 hypothetical protein SPHS6_02472 [Sphingobium sp. S6]
MGMRPAILTALPLLLATPSFAQEQGGSDPVFNLPRTSPPPADPSRQGPELDVFRGAPVTPPASTPVITPPPPVVAQPQPQPVPPAQPQRPATTAPRPTPAEPAAPAREPESSSAAPQASTPQAPAPQPAPAQPAEPQAAPSPIPAAPASEPPLGAPAESASWGWIAGVIALLAAALAAAWLFLRRRSEEEQQSYEEPEAAPAPPPPTPAAAKPVPVPVPPAPRPAEAKPVAPPAAPRPDAPSPTPAAAAADRPWIDLSLEVRSARLSLMGATISYHLTLHNRGERVADDILIRTFIANADAHQQAQLQQFFAGALGLPAHSAVSLAPGHSHSLAGELRLLPDQIAPVQMGDRALLIPLVAFDAQYRWSDEPGTSPTGAGRTGRAFIVGQEKTPPADRLTPFRVDQGPRQFRTPGSRATALELAS